MSWKYIILLALAVIVIGLVLVVRWHSAWLAQQTPLGTWVSTSAKGTITLQFEGEANSGTYKQLTSLESGPVREFGHWAHASGELHLLPIASDTATADPIGVDGVFQVRYVDTNKIQIFGPGRDGEIYEKAPDGTVVNLE